MTDLDRAAVGLLAAGDHPEDGGFAGTVRTDDANDGTRRNLETEVVDQQPVAISLGDVLELYHLVAQPLGHRDEDLLRLVAALVFVGRQFLEAGQTRLALGLPALGILAHPLQLLLQRLLASRLGSFFLTQAIAFLVQPRAVVAAPGNAAAPVQLQDPFGGIVEEVAVVGDGHHRAGELLQELLQPVDALGIEVVGRLIEQQHVRARQQQPAQGHAALLAAREVADLRVPRRQAQRIGRHFQLQLDVVGAGRGDDRLVLGLLVGQRVEVGVRLGIGRIDFFQLLLGLDDVAQAALDGLAHGLLRIKLRLLRQVADLDARHRRGFAIDLLVEAGHDLEQGRLARPVGAEHADLGAGEEAQRDVLEDLAFGWHGLAHPVHRVYVLGHVQYGRGKRRSSSP